MAVARETGPAGETKLAEEAATPPDGQAEKRTPPAGREAAPGKDEPATAKPDAQPVAPLADEALGAKRSQLLERLLGTSEVLLPPNPHYQPTVTEPLHLDDAVGFALTFNYEIASAGEKSTASRWELAGGYGAYLPHIDYTAEIGSERSSPAAFNDATGKQVAINTHHTNDRTYVVRQPLVDPTLIADILVRHKTVSAADAEETAAREKVALDTIASFYRMIQARLVVLFSEQYKTHLDNLASRMNDRVEGGGASRIDLERINARSVTAKSAIIEARSEIDAAVIEFHRLTGQVPLKIAIPEHLMPALPSSGADEVLAKAMQENPDYLAANYHVGMAQADSWKTGSRLLPKLSFEVTDTRSWDSGGSIYNQDPNTITYPYNNERRLMGVLRWSLNGATDMAQTMANAARTRQAEAEATGVRQKIEESVRVAVDALHAANSRIEAVGTAEQENEHIAQVTEEQYIAGSRQLIDLLDAYDRLYQSQIELSRLLISEANAGFLLRRQMGELVPAVISADKP